MPHFRSLRSRFTLPLLLVSVLAASLVATASYWLAQRTTDRQLEQRFAAIRRSLQSSQFPLTRGVLVSLSELTAADWVTLDPGGQIIDTTLGALDRAERVELARRISGLPVDEALADAEATKLRYGHRDYWVRRFRRLPVRGQGGGETVQEVIVLVDDAQWQAIRLRAAAAPLVTGLSTIILLSSVMLFLTSRLISRLTRLQREVEAIAGGQFTSDLQVGPEDEIGRLSMAIQSMAAQLRQMWQALGQQHGQRLLHQIAGGLAHNLRNSLTGARMAVELHERCCHSAGGAPPADEGLRIAIGQLEQTEDYVRRLLLVSSGKQERSRPCSVAECLRDIRTSLDTTACHWNVELSWSVEEPAGAQRVIDGPTLIAAITNLVWNAIQAGDRVEVRATFLQTRSLIQIDVSDNGPGPPGDIADSLFEPFVTSKPEGLGLGLPLVKRSAESLGGTVQWSRHQQRTIFRLQVQASV